VLVSSSKTGLKSTDTVYMVFALGFFFVVVVVFFLLCFSFVCGMYGGGQVSVNLGFVVIV